MNSSNQPNSAHTPSSSPTSQTHAIQNNQKPVQTPIHTPIQTSIQTPIQTPIQSRIQTPTTHPTPPANQQTSRNPSNPSTPTTPTTMSSPTTKHRSIANIQHAKSNLARSSTQELIQENALIFVKPEDVEVDLGEPFQLQAILRHDLNREELYEVTWYCEGVLVEEEEDIFIDCTRNNCRLLFNACLEADEGVYDVSKQSESEA